MTDIDETALGMAIREAEEKGFHRNAAPVAFAIRAYQDALGEQAVDIELGAKAIQSRYWAGDLPIKISEARFVCTEFAKAVAAAWGLTPGAGKEGE